MATEDVPMQTSANNPSPNKDIKVPEEDGSTKMERVETKAEPQEPLPIDLIKKIAQCLEELRKMFDKLDTATPLHPRLFPGTNASQEVLTREQFVGVARMCRAK